MKVRDIAGEGDKGALFSVFLDQCYEPRDLCTTLLLQGGEDVLGIPSSPTFA